MSPNLLLKSIGACARRLDPLWMALTLIALTLMLSGCALNTDFKPAEPVAATASYKEADGRWANVVPASIPANGEWWKAFGDPVLDDLVSRALKANNSIAGAGARLNQARAQLQRAQADKLPIIGLNGGASRSTIQPGLGFPPGAALSNFNLGLGASWEPDLFGRLSKASQAADFDAQSKDALLQNTRLAVAAQVAQTYFALRELDDERDLVRQTVVAYQDTEKLTERRYRAGDVAELDFARVRTEVASTEAQALALDRQRAELEHALAVLVGESASSFSLAKGEWNTPLPVVPAGVPSVMLTRRPDVAAAQRAVLAAQSRAGIARTAWFPDFALTGNAGYASNNLSDLFKWTSRAWGVGALLSLPIFDGGRRQANLDTANAQWDADAAAYRDSVLSAFRDVEDQLSSLRLLGEQAEAENRAVQSASRATALSSTRYRNGYVSQLELLDTQRSELANRRESVQVRGARYQATVGLIRALGGGWGDAPAASASAEAPALAKR